MKKNLYYAIWGGVTTAVVTWLGAWLIGRVSGYEAKILIAGTLSGIHMLCNTVILASATILALLLTVLSISSSATSKLKNLHYIQVKQLALFDTALFIFSMVFFLLLNIPIEQSGHVPADWYGFIYYFALAGASLLGGAIITVVLILYKTVSDIISIVGLKNKEHYLILTDDDEEKLEEIERKHEESKTTKEE